MRAFSEFLSYMMVLSFHCEAVQFGKIENTSLILLSQDPILINGTCNECQCYMYFNQNFSSFNCYRINQTCEMYLATDQYQLFQLLPTISSTFYFRSLPMCPPSVNCSSLSATAYNAILEPKLSSAATYSWLFDSSLADQTFKLNFTQPSSSSPTFSSSMTIFGSGQSILFNSTREQYISISNGFPNLANSSWTFELWLYLVSVPNVYNIGLIVQCGIHNTSLCLHIVIRSQKPYFGFYLNDIGGIQTLSPNQWYHLAFTFDHLSQNQSIYIDGLLDQSRRAVQSYQGRFGYLHVGCANFSASPNETECLNGFIDQLGFYNRSKSPDEILTDATLTCYFSFDNRSLRDQGPLKMNGTVNRSAAAFTAGRVGDALQISSNSPYVFQIHKLALLGMSNRSYSMSIWIFPSSQQPAPIIHVSDAPDSTSQWCLSMLTIHSSGQLAATSYSSGSIIATGPTVNSQQWTHVAFTYSLMNGLRLYVNGTFFNGTASFPYQSNKPYMYITLGGVVKPASACAGDPSGNRQYIGLLDEFRLYSRELSPDEVLYLAYP